MTELQGPVKIVYGSGNESAFKIENAAGVTMFEVRADGTIVNNLGRVAEATYVATNVTTDRSYDADTADVAEVADVLGTLIADLRAAGIIL